MFQLATLNGRRPETGVILDSKPAAVWKLRFPMDEQSSAPIAVPYCVHFAIAIYLCISPLQLLCAFRIYTFCVHFALAHFVCISHLRTCVHFAIAHFVCIPHLQFLCAFRLVTSTAFPSIGTKKQLPPLLTASCSPVPREHSSLSLFPRVATRKQTTKQNRNSIVDAKPLGLIVGNSSGRSCFEAGSRVEAGSSTTGGALRSNGSCPCHQRRWAAARGGLPSTFGSRKHSSKLFGQLGIPMVR